MKALFIFALSALLVLPLAAEWENITANLPEGYAGNSSNGYYIPNAPNDGDFLNPTFGAFRPLGQFLTDGTTILLSTTASVYVSTDNGETFTNTNPPFPLSSTGDAGFNRPSYQSLFRYDQGAFRAINRVETGDDSTTKLHTYDPETSSWDEGFVLVPGLTESAHGKVKFYTRDWVSGQHYVLSEQIGFFSEASENPDARPFSSYLWTSSDRINWQQIDANIQFSRADGFFFEDASLYLQEDRTVYRSNDGGSTWTVVFDETTQSGLFDTFAQTFMLNGEEDFHQNLLDSNSAYLDPELGFGWNVIFINPIQSSAQISFLPVLLEHASKQGSLQFVSGMSILEFGYPIVYYSATNGQTWELLDLQGLGEVDPVFVPGGFAIPLPGIPPQSAATYIVLTDTHAYITLNHTSLWRRPLSELDLRATTRITKQIEHLILEEGSGGTLEVSAVGAGTLSYRWFKDGQEVPDLDQASIIFDSLTAENTGIYSVYVEAERGDDLSQEIRVDFALSFDEFAEQNFPTGMRTEKDDGNLNGISNLDEYLHGSNGLPTMGIVNQRGFSTTLPTEKFLSISYCTRINATDQTIFPRASESIEGLSSGINKVTRTGIRVIDGDFETHTYRTTFTIEESPTGFIQLLIE